MVSLRKLEFSQNADWVVWCVCSSIIITKYEGELLSEVVAPVAAAHLVFLLRTLAWGDDNLHGRFHVG